MMSTIGKPLSTTEVVRCPLCDSPLLENPNQCGKCDWVKGYRHRGTGTSPVDVTASLLSLIPGMGHFYKGHRTQGWFYFGGALFAAFWCFVAATATAGFGLLLLPLYWAWVMTHAYWIEDLKTSKKPA